MQYMDLWSEIFCVCGRSSKPIIFFLYKWFWAYTVTLNCAGSETAFQIICNNITAASAFQPVVT